MSEKVFSSLDFQSLVLRYYWFNQTSFQFSLLLKKEYFEDSRCAEVYQWISYFIKTHGPPATKVMMRNVLSQPKAVPRSLELFNVIIKKSLTSSEEDYVESKVRDFCQFQSVLDVLANKAAGLMAQGKLTELQVLLFNSFEVGRKQFGLGLDYFDATQVQRRIKDRLSGDLKDRFSTWIAELDKFMTFRRGQIAIALGNSGRGKSMFLVYIAKALLMQNLKVVYYTLQLPEDEIASRVDAALSNLAMQDLKTESQAVAAGISHFKNSFKSRFFIKGFPSGFLTVDILRSHLDLLRSTGFNPDAILIDYGNLMTETTARKRIDSSRYEELGVIYEKMMALCQEQGIFALLAHQTKQTSWEKPVLSIADAADSSQAVMVSPLVLTINRNLDDEKAGQARIFIAKNSYGPDGILVTVKTNFPKGQFYVPHKKDHSTVVPSAVVGPSSLKKSRKFKKR